MAKVLHPWDTFGFTKFHKDFVKTEENKGKKRKLEFLLI